MQTNKTAAWILLFGRTALFVLLQGVFALIFWIVGTENAWEAGADLWPFGVFIANLICIGAMIGLYRAEGKNYWDLFRLQRESWRSDVVALLLSFIIIGPLAFLPNILLANLLFDDPATTLDLIVRPLPTWAFYAAAILFPVTQGLAEIPLYFGYVMPHLDARPFPDLRPVILPALMLGFQHLAVPLLFNLPFITWRALMYVPFAFGVGVLLHWRPRLMPYIVVIHALMDLSFILMFLPAVY